MHYKISNVRLSTLLIMTALLIFNFCSAYSQREENRNLNHISAFMGSTSYTSTGSWTAFSAGIDYERIFSESSPEFGAGVYAEAVFHTSTELIFGIPLVIHIEEGPKFWIAPSIITNQKHEGDSTSLIGPNQPGFENIHNSTSTFFMRFGAGWDFHTGNVTLGPSLCADIISSRTYLIFGLNVGFGF